jgi:hypothetical protein
VSVAGFAGGPAVAPLEAEDRLEEDAELHVPGLVQAQLGADCLDLVRRREQAAQDFSRVAAEELEEEEHQQDDARQRGDHLPESA